MSNLFLLVIAAILVLLNGMFVAAEFGIVKIRNTQIQTIKKNTRFYNKILFNIHYQIDSYLSACQLGITLTSLGLGWIGEPAAAKIIEPLIQFLDIKDPRLIQGIAFGAAFVCISFVHIVIGELLPKSISIRYPWQASILTGIPLYFFYYITFPAIWLLNTCSNLLLWLVIPKSTPTHHENYSTEEIKFILHSSNKSGEITPEEAEIMSHTMDFAGLRITEIMRPKEDMITLNINSTVEEALEIINKTRFTRYPVYAKRPDNIVGLLHVKDIFLNDESGRLNPTIKSFIRPILRIPAKNRAIDALKRFRQGVSHFAIIYRGKRILGFLTLDNLLHVIIGKIHDEFHYTTEDWVKNEDGSLTVDGDCSIYFLEKALELDILENEEGTADTVSQLIMSRIQHLPEINETISFDDFTATIKAVENNTIQSVIVRITNKNEENTAKLE